MSWAAHNPEKYDEIVRKGIITYLDKVMNKHAFQVPGEWLEGYEALIEVMSAEPRLRSLYNGLLLSASHEITEAEKDYWGGLADRAKEEYGN